MLRALDTVEDDMTIPNDEKIPMLRKFHTYLQDPKWKYMKSQEKDRKVLEEFPVVGVYLHMSHSIGWYAMNMRQYFQIWIYKYTIWSKLRETKVIYTE